jgi:glycosyltransferase involved in cell wall biosynthesis
MKKKKLVIVTDNFLPRWDGIVRFLTEIIPRLKDQFDITVICPDTKERVSIKHVDFVRIPQSKRVFGDFQFSKFRPSKMVRTIRKADIVFSQTIGPIGGTGLFLAQLFRKKTVSFIHSIDWELFTKAVDKPFLKRYAGPLTKSAVRFLYKRSSYLVVPSERVAELFTWQNINTTKEIIHLGVDTEKFKPIQDPKERQKERERLGIQMDDFVIGYHGRIAREKDLYTLLRAYLTLKKINPRFKLMIIGSGVPEIVAKFQHQEGIVHIPATSNVMRYLPLMDLYVLPSLTETTSLSTLEAMSCQLPVITTPVGYVRDYIKDGVNGVFFPAKNSYILSKKITYLANRKSERDILAKQARKTVVEQFNWDKTAYKLEEFFKKITADDL